MPRTSQRQHIETYCQQCDGQRINSSRSYPKAIAAHRRHCLRKHKGIPTKTIQIQWPQT